jgi:hypothetical protein
MERWFEPLYVLDPAALATLIPSIVGAVARLITTSRFYRQPHRMIVLLYQITNQLVRRCQQHMTELIQQHWRSRARGPGTQGGQFSAQAATTDLTSAMVTIVARQEGGAGPRRPGAAEAGARGGGAAPGPGTAPAHTALLWDCDLGQVVQRVRDCQRLHAGFHAAFQGLRRKLARTPAGPQLNISTHVFARFDR